MAEEASGVPRATGLTAWCDEGRLSGIANIWLAGQPEPRPRNWRRVYARHHGDADPWIVCLLEDDHGRLIRLDGLRGAGLGDLYDLALGAMHVAPFPEDTALPGLRHVLGQLQQARVVRYRPGKRCTLRGFVDEGERFVKIVPGGGSLYQDACAIWAVARAGAISTQVAQPCRWDEATQAFWQAVVPGEPIVAELLGPSGDRLAARLGTALAELARSGAIPTAVHDAPVQIERTGRAVERVSLVLRDLRSELERFYAELVCRHAALPVRDLVPIHGAPHMHQWLMDGPRLGLIDFDRFALGEPEFDLATFVAELDTERGLCQPVAAIEQAMIDGYAAGGITIDRRRAALYRAHKRLSKVMRTAWAVRPNAQERAGRLLADAFAALDAA
jgi:hypothetical protein